MVRVLCVASTLLVSNPPTHHTPTTTRCHEYGPLTRVGQHARPSCAAPPCTVPLRPLSRHDDALPPCLPACRRAPPAHRGHADLRAPTRPGAIGAAPATPPARRDRRGPRGPGHPRGTLSPRRCRAPPPPRAWRRSPRRRSACRRSARRLRARRAARPCPPRRGPPAGRPPARRPRSPGEGLGVGWRFDVRVEVRVRVRIGVRVEVRR